MFFTGASQPLDFMRTDVIVQSNGRYHEDICKELHARKELRSVYDPTPMPAFESVCVTLFTIYHIK